MTHQNIPIKNVLEELEPKDGKIFVSRNTFFHLEDGRHITVEEFFLTTVPFMSGKVYVTKGVIDTHRRRATNFIPAKKVLRIEKSTYEGD